jgi:hypothetical protein
MKHAMIDFETFGKGIHGGTSAVCQVGACYFDPLTGEVGKTISMNIDADSHVHQGDGKLDADTVYWWLQQSDAARKSLLENRLNIHDAMLNLNEFLKDAKHIWSHATFDFVLLGRCLRSCNIKPNFSYKAGMDIRTLVYLAGTQVSKHERAGTHHNGLDDCIYQVKYVTEALNVVKANKALLRQLDKLESYD